MHTTISHVVPTRDGGRDCWDTTITARDIAKAFKNGLLDVDPDHQRGRDSVTGKYILKEEKVDRWAHELQEDKAIFGQLTWNFRPESSKIEFKHEGKHADFGTLIIKDGTAYLPDSVHRHYAIRKAVESIAHGSSFDPDRRFSLRIWQVPEEYENEIFYAMNMEHDKADATRSKWLAQRNPGQQIAREVVRRSQHLGQANVETVTNKLSVKNPRLAAFNTFASGFEEAWGDVHDTVAAVKWFLPFWDQLVSVLPELRRLPLPERQAARKNSLVSWAISIQGFIRLARRFRDEGRDLSLLKRLARPVIVRGGKKVDFFSWHNPAFQRAGIIVPAINQAGEKKLTVRNSHQTRRAMAEVLANQIGLGALGKGANAKAGAKKAA